MINEELNTVCNDDLLEQNVLNTINKINVKYFCSINESEGEIKPLITKSNKFTYENVY